MPKEKGMLALHKLRVCFGLIGVIVTALLAVVTLYLAVSIFSGVLFTLLGHWNPPWISERDARL
jgi:hypothetical protein